MTTEQQIKALTVAMLQHTKSQNMGVAVGAALNVLMSILNHAPEDMREGISLHLHMIADKVTPAAKAQVHKIDGVDWPSPDSGFAKL